MEQVRNLDGKLVCSVDQNTRLIEIIRKDCATHITILHDGKIQIKHKRITKAA